jgi:hypothetical protein
MKTRLITSLLLAFAVFACSVGARAADAPAGDTDYKSLDQQVQSLQQEILDVNRDLFTLEEELLYPATTQVSVFLSMDVGEFFQLDSVQLKIGDKEVANYLYTQREVEALKRGGVQRLYIGNLKLGEHELVAFFTGKGPHERDYRRGANLNFKKGIGPKYIELKIVDQEKKQEPEFSISEWE